MAADQIKSRVHDAPNDGEIPPLNTRDGSPSAQKKRRQRSPMSPDRGVSRGKSSGSRSSDFRSPSPGSRILVTDINDQMRYPSAQSSASASGTATNGSSSSRGGHGEDALTLRRREANRLAAQRFRSRKKGYQDSLEDRIRILEEEKDSISQRLIHSHQRSPHDEGFLRHHDMYRRSPGSPDNKNLDVDVRVASLESANRRLQDELRGVVEDNERLRDEVERWRRWDRDMRETRRDDDRYNRGAPTLPPLEAKYMAPPTFPSSTYPPAYPPAHPAHPPLERSQSYTSNTSRRPISPGPRLPPLRLGHAEPPFATHVRPLLPRPESMERLSTIGHPQPHLSPTHSTLR